MVFAVRTKPRVSAACKSVNMLMNAWGSYLRDFHVRLYRFLETSRGVDLDPDGARSRATSYFLGRQARGALSVD